MHLVHLRYNYWSTPKTSKTKKMEVDHDNKRSDEVVQ